MPGFIRIAHRGAPRRALENTLESFRVARLAGARFFELDVWLSKDGVPMVCHDKCLRRISGHKGKVSMLTRSQIQEINLPNGERIPTLKEVLSELEDAEHTIYVEMKDPNPRVVSTCLDAVHGILGKWVLSSFTISHVHLAHALYPRAKTQVLLDRLFLKRLNALPGDEIGISDSLATPRLIEKMVRLQKPLFVYTVNDSHREEELKRQGVAGVFTDTW